MTIKPFNKGVSIEAFWIELDYLQVQMKNAAGSSFDVFTLFTCYRFYIHSCRNMYLFPEYMKVSIDASNPRSPNVGVKRGLPVKF